MRAIWAISDQGIVSLGTFLVGVLIARYLSPTEYGVFSLLLNGAFTLQLVTGALIFYPVSIQRAVLAAEARSEQMVRAFIILVGLCTPLCMALAGAILFFERQDLLGPSLAYFLSLQVQELMRRGLLAEMRHREALIGDSISYLGQVTCIGLLVLEGYLSLPNTLYAMAATSGIAALIQIKQLHLALRLPADIRQTVRDFWSLGSWSLGSGAASTLRVLLLPWVLAALHGPIQAGFLQASFAIINLVNPVLFGVGNIIPQVAAKAHPDGKKQAWIAVRPYALAGAPPIVCFYTLILINPEVVLRIVYGADWPPHEVALAMRVLAVSSIMSYATEMVCFYLHGVDAPRRALVINSIGLAVVVALVFPMTIALGLSGACLSLMVANVFRLAAARFILTGLLHHKTRAPLETLQKMAT